jgi:hypothetical protein
MLLDLRWSSLKLLCSLPVMRKEFSLSIPDKLLSILDNCHPAGGINPMKGKVNTIILSSGVGPVSNLICILMIVAKCKWIHFNQGQATVRLQITICSPH